MGVRCEDIKASSPHSTHRPILCAIGPNTFVPIKYEIEAGRNAAPRSKVDFGDFAAWPSLTLLKFTGSHRCHHPDRQRRFQHRNTHISKRNGTCNGLQLLRISFSIVLPAARRMYGSLINVFNDAPWTGSPETAGCKTVNCNTRQARVMMRHCS